MACLEVIEVAAQPRAVHSLCEFISAIYVLGSFGYEKINELRVDF